MRKFIVNPNLYRNGWFDPKSQTNFFKRNGAILVSDEADYSNISRYLKLNYLIEITEGSVKDPEITSLVTKTPNELLSEVEPVELAIPEIENIPEEDIPLKEEKQVEEVPLVADKLICKYCNKKYSSRGIHSHETACKQNPNNM